MSGAGGAVAMTMPVPVSAAAAGEAGRGGRHQKTQGQQAQRYATHRGLLSRDRPHDDRSGLPWPYAVPVASSLVRWRAVRVEAGLLSV